ncbi:MAG: hypothetical protein OXQ94_14575 [Gemmatimonadota bacterium]|nr:hypothetical protein [Gemmatimonadota bacterium]MDE2872900.1 hypothetical protein [Gemmatimonadota bacterium]
MTATRITGAGRHSVTVPAHRELRPGTLAAIVSDVADHLGGRKSPVREKLFG